MQVCMVKCTLQPNVWDNSAESSVSYQIQQKQLVKASPITRINVRRKGVGVLYTAWKRHFSLTKGIKETWAENHHSQFPVLAAVSWWFCGQTSPKLSLSSNCKKQLMPLASTENHKLIYQVLTEMAYFFSFKNFNCNLMRFSKKHVGSLS